MKKSIVFLLAMCVMHIVSGQDPWLATSFRIDQFHVTMFYLDSVNDHFYIGGEIRTVDSIKTNRIFYVDADENVFRPDTTSKGNGPSGTPNAMIRYNDTLFLAAKKGLYMYRDSFFSEYLEVFNYEDINGYDNSIQYLMNYKNKMLFCGGYNLLVQPPDGFVIMYDGNNFSSFNNFYNLAGGFFASFDWTTVNVVCEYKTKLYVGGNFQYNGFNTLASFDGSNWDRMGLELYPISSSSPITDMVVYKDELYIAGYFRDFAGNTPNRIIKWDGEKFYSLGNGIVDGLVEDLFVYDDELWVVGLLDSVDNLALSNVAIWNGEYWCSPGGEFSHRINVAGEYRDTLYIGGNFTSIDGDMEKKYVAKYNPAAPRTCGSPVAVNPLGNHEFSQKQHRVNVFPNPSNGIIQVQTGNLSLPVRWRLMDYQGRSLREERQMMNQFELDLSEYNGFFVLELLDAENRKFNSKIQITGN